MRNVIASSKVLNWMTTYRKKIVRTVVLIATMFALLGLPVFTLPAYAGPGGTYVDGWAMRFNVSDLYPAIAWYEDNLGLSLDVDYGVYAELSYPYSDSSNTKIALSEGPAAGSNQATATIVVSDIIAAQDALQVPSTPICDAGGGVALTFFCDLDENSLAFRQDGFPGGGGSCPSPVCPY